MSFWYNKKDDAKLANLACSEWKEVNSKIEFDELGFARDESFYYIYSKVNRFTDVMKMGDKDFKIGKELVTFKIARKDYTKKDWKTKVDVQVPQSRVEKWVCSVFDVLDATKRYKGFLDLQDGNYLDTLLSGRSPEGKELQPEFLEMMQSTYRDFKETESKEIGDDLIVVPAGYSGSSYSKGQTEIEKIKDRIAILETHAKKIFEIEDNKDAISFLAEQLQSGNDKASYFLQVITLVL